MSLNTAHANGGVLIFAGERILLYCDDVEMAFSEVSMPHFKGNKKGRLYLTTHRVIFNSTSGKDQLQSFSIPFLSMREIELEQPVFGSNYIKGKVVAEEGGGWTGTVKIKMWFKSGGAIEFGQAMLRAGQLASRNRPPQPPPYTPPQGPIYQAPPPAYTASQTEYGWVPHMAFPTAPPAENVYTTEQPPPYPGVDPGSTPYPQPQPNGYPQPQPNGYPQPQANGYTPQGATAQESSAEAKAREAAAGGAYYNPSAPHNVYMTQQQYPAPPSYSEATKKNQ